MVSRARGPVVSVILGMLALAPGSFCAAPALASHVRCGDTITTDTTLDSDLLDCPGYGVWIGADDVTLDLNGHTISGTGAGMGIRNQAFDRVVVENGVVTGFQGGIWLLGTIENRLSNLTVTANDLDGIRLLPLGGTVASSGNVIEHSRIHGNGQGIVLIRSTGNRLDENVVAGNDKEGVQLTDSSGNRIETNSVSDNGQPDFARKVGIALSRSHDNRIAQNSVSGHLGEGITLEGSHGNQLQRNLLEDNGYSIYLKDSNGNSVQANRVLRQEGIGGLGIAVFRSDTNLITANSLSAQGRALEVVGTGNVVERNRIRDAGTEGIVVAGASSRVAHNHVSTTLYSGVMPYPGITGIELSSAHASVVESNSVSGFYEALRIYDSTDNVIRKNRLFGGADLKGLPGFPVFGIFVFASSDRNQIEQNVVSAVASGIYVADGGTRIERNIVTGNYSGIYISYESTGTVIAENAVTNNTAEGITMAGRDTVVSRNIVSGNGTFGILVYFAPAGVVERNVANRNGRTGIYVGNVQTTIRNNRANRNGDLGIEAYEGSIDGGGNKAHGNGNPLQCLNVVCR